MAATPRICDLDIVLEAVHGRVLVDLRCDGKSMGEISAYDVVSGALRGDCHKQFNRARRHTRLPLVAYVVFWSQLSPKLRGTGIGTALYLAAAEGASRIGGALVQHACFFDEGEPGSTSELARNVWESARFREQVVLFGNVVAYMPQSHWGAARQMLHFGQLDVPMRNRHRKG